MIYQGGQLGHKRGGGGGGGSTYLCLVWPQRNLGIPDSSTAFIIVDCVDYV